MAIRTLAKLTNTGTGTLQLAVRAIEDHTFRVDGIKLKIAATIVNSDGSAHTMLAATFGHNWTLTYKYADGMKWYDGIPLIAVERIAEQTRQNFLTNPVELAKTADGVAAAADDKYAVTGTAPGGGGAITAGEVTNLRRSYQKEIRDRYIAASATEVETFELWLPLARPNASRPLDFSQALSLLGKCDLKLTNDTGSSYLTVSSFTAEAIAVGEIVDNFYAGTRVQHFIQGSQVNMVDDVIGFSGKRLLALHDYTIDNSGSPLAGVDLVAKLDGKRTIVELNNSTTITELNKLSAVPTGGFPAASERVFTDAVLVVTEPYKYSILDLPVSRGLNLHYSSNAATAGKHFHVVSVVAAKGEACRAAVYPGAGDLTPAGLDRVTRVAARNPAIDPNVLKNLRAWLPEEVFTPEATGSASCGA